jgi:hypothetical protein
MGRIRRLQVILVLLGFVSRPAEFVEAEHVRPRQRRNHQSRATKFGLTSGTFVIR